jgi:hypothetical protein
MTQKNLLIVVVAIAVITVAYFVLLNKFNIRAMRSDAAKSQGQLFQPGQGPGKK